MIIEIIVLSILGIKLFNGSYSNLLKYSYEDIKGKSFFIMGFLLFSLTNMEFMFPYYIQLSILTFLFLIIGFLLNYKNFGFILIASGFILNLLPVLFNGKMPVDYNALIETGNQRKIYYITNGYSLSHGIFAEPKLRFLTDIIPLRSPYYNPKVISLGDIFINAGIIIAIIIISRRKK